VARHHIVQGDAAQDGTARHLAHGREGQRPPADFPSQGVAVGHGEVWVGRKKPTTPVGPQDA
jgi:hypothetical protein